MTLGILPMATAARAVRMMALTSIVQTILNETLPRVEVKSTSPLLSLAYSNRRSNNFLSLFDQTTTTTTTITPPTSPSTMPKRLVHEPTQPSVPSQAAMLSSLYVSGQQQEHQQAGDMHFLLRIPAPRVVSAVTPPPRILILDPGQFTSPISNSRQPEHSAKGWTFGSKDEQTVGLNEVPVWSMLPVQTATALGSPSSGAGGGDGSSSMGLHAGHMVKIVTAAAVDPVQGLLPPGLQVRSVHRQTRQQLQQQQQQPTHNLRAQDASQESHDHRHRRRLDSAAAATMITMKELRMLLQAAVKHQQAEQQHSLGQKEQEEEVEDDDAPATTARSRMRAGRVPTTLLLTSRPDSRDPDLNKQRQERESQTTRNEKEGKGKDLLASGPIRKVGKRTNKKSRKTRDHEGKKERQEPCSTTTTSTTTTQLATTQAMTETPPSPDQDAETTSERWTDSTADGKIESESETEKTGDEDLEQGKGSEAKPGTPKGATGALDPRVL